MPRASRKQDPTTPLEVVCVVLVVLAVAALVAWITTQAGGGHFLT